MSFGLGGSLLSFRNVRPATSSYKFKSNFLKNIEVEMSFLVAAGAGYCFVRCMDQGFADAMGLHTLRHGTDPVAWFKVHFAGAKLRCDRSSSPLSSTR